ncbi:MAG: nicotinate-nucleotide adenylyltransferase [Alphaproteobacteria bacterium]|nr:nicotinate-nucleotide adenylyltransferase [Alphaproteobacteria bacterium]
MPRRRPARLARLGGARASGRIGLLGGSFNPAHAGHRHISLLALKRLRLDEVWWLVSPQNPLKPTSGMAPFADRMRAAAALARHPRIRASQAEAELGTRYTIDTLVALTRRLPRARFVWLMGADNLGQMPRWAAWPDIFERAAIAVFARPTYSLKALAGKAARRFARRRRHPAEGPCLARHPLPAWVFFATRFHPASATAIRAQRPVAAEPGG